MYYKIFKLYLFSANEHAKMKKTTFIQHGLIKFFCSLHVRLFISGIKIHEKGFRGLTNDIIIYYALMNECTRALEINGKTRV